MSILLPPAIDGHETGFDSTQPLSALVAFYRAFNHRDLDAMACNWATDADVSMSNPLGGIARGWTAVRMIYERILAGHARVHVEFHDFTLHEAGDFFHAVGRGRGSLVNGDTRLELAIRTSRLYRRTDGTWRQVHHHGSFDDPILLAAYREAVR